MKITISSNRVNGDHVILEAEDVGIAFNAYMTLENLSKQGLFPASLGPRVLTGGALPGPVATDAGVQFPLSEPQADAAAERVNAVAPEVPERETRKPGKTRKARQQAAENVAPAAPALDQQDLPLEEPAPAENVAENVAPKGPVSQDEARAAMVEAAKLGQPALVKILGKLGVARFGLYVADDYAPVLRAIEEVKAEMAAGGAE